MSESDFHKKEKDKKARNDRPKPGDQPIDATVSFEYTKSTQSTESGLAAGGDENLIEPGMLLGGQYLAVHLAGSGKMGEVWEAHDNVSERTVAVKVVSSNIAHYEEVMRLVKTNFQSVHTLNHQYICPLYALAEDSRIGYFLVMKWMPEMLDDYIAASERLPMKTILTILSNIGDALDYAHENGVIHRDVKPKNIAITRTESGEFVSASLIDFGLALGLKKFTGDHSEKTTESSSERSESSASSSNTRGEGSSAHGPRLSGTPAYMPPEQWRGEDQDKRTDQYSLAVVAYELIAGSRPFTSHNRSVLRASVLRDQAEPISGVPRYVNAALMKALSKKKEDRFSTCAEFVCALGDSQWQHKRRNSIIRTMVWVLLTLGLVYVILFLPERNADKETWEQRFNNVFERNVYTNKLRDINQKSRGTELPVGLFVNGKLSADWTISASGPNWTYEWNDEERVGTLTLNNYQAGKISASGFDLKVLVADGTRNSITVIDEEDALSVTDGSLSIVGSGAGTGRLLVRAISTVKSPEDISDESLNTNAICINTSGENLSIENLAELDVSSQGCNETILVSSGNFSSKNVKNLTVEADRGRHAAAVFGNTYIIGEENDVYAFNGVVCFQGEFWVNGDRESGETPAVPGIQLSVAGTRIDYLIDTFRDAVLAFSDVSDDTVMMLTANFTTSTYQHPTEGTISRLIADENGKYTLLAGGAFNINRGGSCNRMEEMIDVRGELTINYPDCDSNRTVRLVGGASWKRGDQIPKAAKLERPVSFFLGSTEKDKLEIYKYDNKMPSYAVLINVSGTLNTYPGFYAQDNDNVNIEEYASSTVDNQKLYAGGVNVAVGGTFNMYAGEIFECAAPFGAGVNVNGTFNMYGGAIRNNVAWNNGGEYTSEGAGVRIRRGTFNMYGGSIINNVAAGKSTVDEAVSAKNSELSQLLGTNAAKGAGIHNSANSTVNIFGGIISGNISQWAGGGIYAGGNGTGKMTITGGTKITGNLAVVGGGIFMNSAVTLEDVLISGNMVIENKGETFVGVTTPNGDGVFIRELAKGNLNKAPSLIVGSKTKIDKDNKVYIQSNIILPPNEGNVRGTTFVPFHVSEPLEGAGEVLTFNVGFLGFIQETDNRTDLALMEEKVPNVPIPLVSFDYATNDVPITEIAKQADKFQIDRLESAPAQTYRMKEYRDNSAKGESAKYYLVITDER